MNFQEMATELGWTYHQVVEFGGHFLDGDFEQRKQRESSILSASRGAKALSPFIDASL
jgi:hypothetical protein